MPTGKPERCDGWQIGRKIGDRNHFGRSRRLHGVARFRPTDGDELRAGSLFMQQLDVVWLAPVNRMTPGTVPEKVKSVLLVDFPVFVLLDSHTGNLVVLSILLCVMICATRFLFAGVVSVLR